MSDSVRCQVCGKPLDSGSSSMEEYHGETYLFDSMACLTTFQLEPESYISKVEESAEEEPMGPQVGSARPGS
ncbi:MAG: YHS domain-containing protein [Propionibacteriaceae bacterium]